MAHSFQEAVLGDAPVHFSHPSRSMCVAAHLLTHLVASYMYAILSTYITYPTPTWYYVETISMQDLGHHPPSSLRKSNYLYMTTSEHEILHVRRSSHLPFCCLLTLLTAH